MPELNFTLDPATGKLELHVRGIAGPACEEVARLARELLGEPGHEELTPEYHLRTQVRPQVHPNQGA